MPAHLSLPAEAVLDGGIFAHHRPRMRKKSLSLPPTSNLSRRS